MAAPSPPAPHRIAAPLRRAALVAAAGLALVACAFLLAPAWDGRGGVALRGLAGGAARRLSAPPHAALEERDESEAPEEPALEEEDSVEGELYEEEQEEQGEQEESEEEESEEEQEAEESEEPRGEAEASAPDAAAANATAAATRASAAGEVRVQCSAPRHYGQDCWAACGGRAGLCNWCGHGNACCRHAAAGDPQICQGVSFFGYILHAHTCVNPNCEYYHDDDHHYDGRRRHHYEPRRRHFDERRRHHDDRRRHHGHHEPRRRHFEERRRHFEERRRHFEQRRRTWAQATADVQDAAEANATSADGAKVAPAQQANAVAQQPSGFP